jgi:hypothetical protein
MSFNIPAIDATHADPQSTSDRFAFVSTRKVMNVLEECGWKAVRSYGSTSDPFARHRIHFRRSADEARREQFGGDSVPEAVLFNGHNGTTRFRLVGGIFRIICSNGMVVCDDYYGQVRTSHLAIQEDEIIKASEEIVANFSNLADVVEDWKSQDMPNKNEFAFEASKLRWNMNLDDDTREVLARDLLNERRPEDSGNKIWSVFNRVQENITQGGWTNPITNRIVKPISEVYRNTRINQELFQLGVNSYALN